MELFLNRINNSNSLKYDIRTFSYSIGFEKVGFTKPIELHSEIDKYESWLSLKYNASMHYLEKNLEKRRDIRLIMSDVKSIIVFAHSYFTNISYNNYNYKVSRYAWGK